MSRVDGRVAGRLPRFLTEWAMTAVAVWVATQLVPGLRVDGALWHYFVVAILMGFVSATFGFLLRVITLPLILLTLGLFLLVINGIVLAITAALLPFFAVESFAGAILGALIITFLTKVLDVMVGRKISQ